MSLDWQGSNVLSKLREAQLRGVNKTIGDSAIHAKANHPWQNQNFFLEGSIRIVAFAHTDGMGVVGTWGSVDIVYAKRLEFGFKGTDSLGRKVNARAYPYLIPAAKTQYPRLAANIKAALAR